MTRAPRWKFSVGRASSFHAILCVVHLHYSEGSMDAAPNDAPLRESYLRPPELIFGGLPGLALAARLCRDRLDDGTWVGLASVARKLSADDSYSITGTADWKARCPCKAVHVLPPRRMVTCDCDRILMGDGDAVWVFELGPQEDE